MFSLFRRLVNELVMRRSGVGRNEVTGPRGGSNVSYETFAGVCCDRLFLGLSAFTANTIKR